MTEGMWWFSHPACSCEHHVVRNQIRNCSLYWSALLFFSKSENLRTPQHQHLICCLRFTVDGSLQIWRNPILYLQFNRNPTVLTVKYHIWINRVQLRTHVSLDTAVIKQAGIRCIAQGRLQAVMVEGKGVTPGRRREHNVPWSLKCHFKMSLQIKPSESLVGISVPHE